MEHNWLLHLLLFGDKRGAVAATSDRGGPAGWNKG